MAKKALTILRPEEVKKQGVLTKQDLLLTIKILRQELGAFRISQKRRDEIAAKFAVNMERCFSK